jgi:hypothetical protein
MIYTSVYTYGPSMWYRQGFRQTRMGRVVVRWARVNTTGPRWVGYIHGYEKLGRYDWAQMGGSHTWVLESRYIRLGPDGWVTYMGIRISVYTTGPRWVGHIHGYEMLGRHGWAQVGGVYTWVHTWV